MELKETRKQLGLTQPEAAALLNIPFRTYCRYEDEKQYEGSFKYNQMLSLLKVLSIFEGLIEVEIIEATTFKVSFKLLTLTLGCLSLTSLIYVSFKIEVACFAFPESFFCS